MNAGRDVERLIADWLVEEAEVRAPDRVLESARRTIDRTLQRRWVAAWREPVTLTMTKLAALAAALVLALAGAAYVGRLSAGVGAAGPAPSGSPTPAATVAGVALGDYRARRDQICERYAAALEPLKPSLEGLYDAGLSPSERAAKLANLTKLRDSYESMVDELARLEAPADVRDDHTEDVGNLRSVATLLREAVRATGSGELAAAAAYDMATDPFSNLNYAFESKYLLSPCP